MGSFARQSAIVLVVWLSCWIEAGGSTVLQRGDHRTPTEPDTVTTFGGAVTFSASVVTPATALPVGWLMDTFDAAPLDQSKQDLVSMSKRLPGRSLRLVVLRAAQAETYGPFSGSVRLEQTLADIGLPAAAPGADAQAVKPASVTTALDGLVQNVDLLGSQWSSALVVGKLADLAPDIRGYATALLTRAFGTRRLRAFVHSPPSGDSTWNAFCLATGGEVVPDMSELPRMLDERAAYLEATWTPARAPAGFVLFPAVLADDHADTVMAMTDVADAGAPLPSIDAYAAQQAGIREASEMFHRGKGYEAHRTG